MPLLVPRSSVSSPVRWGIPDSVLTWVVGFACSIAGFVFMAALAAAVGKVPASGIPANFKIPTLIVGVFTQNLGIIGCLIVIARLKGRGSLSLDFGFVLRLRDGGWILIGLVLSLVAGVMLIPITDLAGLRGSSQEIVKQFERAQGLEIPLFALVVALLAPVAEELLFRGILLRSLMRRMNAPWAVTLSALIFAFIHVAGDVGTYYYLPAFMLLGLLSGYRAVRTGVLSQSIGLHVGFNLLASILIISGS